MNSLSPEIIYLFDLANLYASQIGLLRQVNTIATAVNTIATAVNTIATAVICINQFCEWE